MRLGLGTGSTAAHFVDALGDKVKRGLEASSACRPRKRRASGRTPRHPAHDARRDAGARSDRRWRRRDRRRLRLIKGGGGALLREKIVATSSKRMIVIADESKVVRHARRFPAAGRGRALRLLATMHAIEAIAVEAGCRGAVTLRPGTGEAPFVTDNGNLILDCALGTIPEPEVLAFALKRVPGVVEHGLFLGLADLAIVAGGGGVRALRRAGA